ncbi:hypothetical protein O4M88_20560 [Vibrio parahaemolyticus]|uniref:hypothetical protein n=1 Tax=Vibrio parahaemolyticus TaxID=670 RepID=UPI0022B375A0|nr:hypothetical protein [Vibrio parahaemolyticus]MCZ6278726.1 hypothetical protein [Vibrio parahaemolyticus]
MNPLLLQLLLMQSNQTQQNPLLALLGNQQKDPMQQLIEALSAGSGMQPNGLNPQLLSLLSGGSGQSTPNSGMEAQLLQLLMQQAGGKKQEPDLSKLLEALGGKKPQTVEDMLGDLIKNMQGGDEPENDEMDIIAQLVEKQKKQKTDNTNQAELTDAIKFNLQFKQFISDNEDLFPDWFTLDDVTEGVDKWAKNETERAQGLAAAAVKAFFKDEGMLELLEERDRNTVRENITKEGLKSHEIDRSIAWPVLERAIYNKTKLSDANVPAASGKDESTIANFGERFEQGQQSESGAA